MQCRQARAYLADAVSPENQIYLHGGLGKTEQKLKPMTPAEREKAIRQLRESLEKNCRGVPE